MRRAIRPPPRLGDNPELERWLRDLADTVRSQFDDLDERVPSQRTVDVDVVSRGVRVESSVSHTLGRVPTAFIVIGTPNTRDDDDLWTIKQSRKAIGTETIAYFKTTAPRGKVFRVRLEVR